MDILLSVLAVAVALSCMVALFISSARDRKAQAELVQQKKDQRSHD
ncbi:MAG: hypothetical protein OEU86_04385 [Gammaproteobacteria bacterium]|jgi:heme exporter protein D|nr:hypothetical protein [Gammaproteobacteria bacterium]